MPNSTTVQPRLSVVVPCYDEERRLPASLVRLQEFLEGFGHPYELLIVDDGSKDGTVALAEKAAAANPNIRVLQYPDGKGNQGKGAAVQHGMLHARGDWVLFTDADLSTPMRELEKFLPYLDQGYDVVIASRALKESELKVRQSFLRERIGRVMNLLIRSVGGLPFADTQCVF
jgi:dolichyl-phosphate beta-glucosyltransferase